MTNITIPSEALEAAARAICEHLRSNWVFDGNPRHSEARDDMLAQARAAIAAALTTWPGVTTTSWFQDDSFKSALNLPLPQKEGDA